MFPAWNIFLLHWQRDSPLRLSPHPSSTELLHPWMQMALLVIKFPIWDPMHAWANMIKTCCSPQSTWAWVSQYQLRSFLACGKHSINHLTPDAPPPCSLGWEKLYPWCSWQHHPSRNLSGDSSGSKVLTQASGWFAQEIPGDWNPVPLSPIPLTL